MFLMLLCRRDGIWLHRTFWTLEVAVLMQASSWQPINFPFPPDKLATVFFFLNCLKSDFAYCCIIMKALLSPQKSFLWVNIKYLEILLFPWYPDLPLITLGFPASVADFFIFYFLKEIFWFWEKQSFFSSWRSEKTLLSKLAQGTQASALLSRVGSSFAPFWGEPAGSLGRKTRGKWPMNNVTWAMPCR